MVVIENPAACVEARALDRTQAVSTNSITKMASGLTHAIYDCSSSEVHHQKIRRNTFMNQTLNVVQRQIMTKLLPNSIIIWWQRSSIFLNLHVWKNVILKNIYKFTTKTLTVYETQAVVDASAARPTHNNNHNRQPNPAPSASLPQNNYL